MEKNKHQNTISISKLYHDTLETYIGHFLKFAGISVAPQIVTVVLGLALGVTVFSSSLHLETILALFSFGNRFALMSMVLLLLIAIVQVFGICALAVMVVHKERISFSRAIKESTVFIIRYIGFGIVFLLTGVVGSLIAFLPLLLLSTFLGAFSQELLNDWFDYLSYLLPMGASVLTTYVTFAGFSIIDKNHSLGRALKHSVALVKGHFWPVAIRLLLGYAVVLTLGYVFQFIPFVSQLIIWMTVSPLTVIYTYVLYNDLSTRKISS